VKVEYVRTYLPADEGPGKTNGMAASCWDRHSDGVGLRFFCKPFGWIGCSITLFSTFPVESHRGFPFIPLDMKTRTNSAMLAAAAAGAEKRR